jgi:hypothetical protein
MSTIRELVFDWLFNASVQIGLFAILAAGLSPLIAKAKAKYQHCFYLAIFAFCLAAPVDHPGARCENCALCYLAGAFSL